MARQYTLDTETTGLKSKEGDRVIELAIVEVTRDPNPRSLHMYFNPGDREIAQDAFEVHGISKEFLADKPTFGECIGEILEFLGEDPELIIHNAPFDLEFLRDEFIEAGDTWPEYPVFDTLKAAAKKWPGGRHSLDALCNRFGVDISARTKHGGLIDCILLAQLYLAWFGQGGLELEAKTTVVAKEDISNLGALNTIVVPINETEVMKALPAKSWDAFFAEHAV